MKQPKRIREFQAKTRSADFAAGLEAAKATIAPLIMRRYFVRGMGAGWLLSVLTMLAAMWAMKAAGWVVLRLPL